MQTALSKESKTNPAPRRKKRGGLGGAMVLAGLVFFTVYMLLAKQMEGISFDTTFIAAFCTLLSVFCTRCFIGAIIDSRKARTAVGTKD